MDDNLYPLDGSAFNMRVESDKQLEDKEREISETLSAIPLLKEIVDHLIEKIDFYNSINSVPDSILTSPDEFMHLIAANKQTVNNLEVEKEYILSRVENTKR